MNDWNYITNKDIGVRVHESYCCGLHWVYADGTVDCMSWDAFQKETEELDNAKSKTEVDPEC